ncbi:hypothetical protein [Arthrobacter sp. CG_A4]|uniref:hypothetical protein n=1 Tax=Arthrobacter sp. CG_A4 TaxID=3071706 RepID=UPI002E091559|nr:hypothetical protein [Arthrobacter sp. CG_A4]
MSNPSDVTPPQQPGAQPPQGSNAPPAGSEPPQVTPTVPEGYQTPQGYQPPSGSSQPPQGHQPPSGSGQPPQGYQAPQGYQPPSGSGQPPQGYQAPQGYQPPSGSGQPPQGYPQDRPAPAGGFRFEMPAGRPKTFNDVMPRGGLSGMFTVTGMPTELKVSYWVWLIGGLLGLLGGIIVLFGSFVLFAFAPGVGLVVLLLALVALALAAAQIVLAMKMKEGHEWARFALTIVAGISLLLNIISAGAVDGRGTNWSGFLISLAATVLMWLPNSQAWFASVRGRA